MKYTVEISERGEILGISLESNSEKFLARLSKKLGERGIELEVNL